MSPADRQNRCAQHPRLAAGAASMPGLVNRPPESARLEVAGGTGLG